MVSIRRPLNPGIRSTKDTAFIQCVYGREPHIHEFWSLILDGIILKFHPKACVEVISRTVGEFVTNLLEENRIIIQIIGEISINDGIQFLGLPAQAWGRGFPFLRNL